MKKDTIPLHCSPKEHTNTLVNDCLASKHTKAMEHEKQLSELDTLQIVGILAARGWRGTIFDGKETISLTDETQPTGEAPTTE